MTFGIYTLGNDKVIAELEVLIRSIRQYNTNIPISVIPFNESMTETRRLCSRYDVKIVDQDLSKFDQIGSTFTHPWEVGPKIFRKFHCFEGEFDSFLFLDADTIVLGSLEPYIELQNKRDHDLIFYTGSAANRNVNEPTFKAFASAIIPEWREGFNAAFILSHKGVFSFEFMEFMSRNMKALETKLGIKHEQAFLNYCAVVCASRTTSLRIVNASKFAPWNSESELVETPEGFRYKDFAGDPVIALHFGGMNWGKGPNKSLLKRFSSHIV